MILKVYGERNTGTNYLLKLLRKNVKASLLRSEVPADWRRWQEWVPGNEFIRDLYFKMSFKQNLGWKHTAVPEPDVLQTYQLYQNPDLKFLTLTKNPYAWILSLHKRPYHRYYDGPGQTLLDFVQTPWKTVHRDGVSERVLASPVELWNLKVASYDNLPVDRTLNLTSVQLIANPEAVIHQIVDQFGIPLKSRKFIDHIESTKDDSKDSNWYRDYYVNEKWKHKLSPEVIEAINLYLDKELVVRRGLEVI